MLASFLLLGLVCTLLVFLIQRASKRQLTHLQKQLFALEEKNCELLEQIAAQKTILSEQSKETERHLSHLEQELEEARLPPCSNAQDKRLIELSATHLQLRKQFEEKSTLLNQTRKELFAIEGQLFTLQREKVEQECLLSAECHQLLEYLQQCEEEHHTLEMELQLLEQLVSSLLSQKPKAARRKKTSEEDFFCITLPPSS